MAQRFAISSAISSVPMFTAYTSMPPAPPSVLPKLGGYCLRATVDVLDRAGCPVAKVTGYDTNPAIGKDTEYMCTVHLKHDHTLRRRKLVCGQADVSLLHNSPLQCSGQFFWCMDGKTRSIT